MTAKSVKPALNYAKDAYIQVNNAIVAFPAAVDNVTATEAVEHLVKAHEELVWAVRLLEQLYRAEVLGSGHE